MGLLPFGQHRIGFWMAERTSAPELPPGLTPVVEGTPTPEGSTLVLVGANEAGEPVWALLLHAAVGASLLISWEDRLFVAVGESAVLIDERGRVLARKRFEDELLSAWRTPEGLLLFGRHGARLINPEAQEIWTQPLRAEGFQPLDLEGGRYRLAAMRDDGWDEIVLDARTGAMVSA
jgi:hypothetical protein